MTKTVTRGKFVWHELLTKDTAAAGEFYRAVIGWTPKSWPGANHGYTIWNAGEEGVGGMMIVPPEAEAMGARPSWLGYVSVPNVDETLEQAVRLGGAQLGEVMTVPDVGRLAVLHDPQGAVIAVMTPDGPDVEETDPKLLEFSWHELLTTDYRAAAQFYEQLFGWEKKSEFDMGDMGTYYMFGRDRFTYGGMFNKPAAVKAPPHWLYYVMVDSADAAAERAKQRGGTVINGPMDVPGGDRIAAILDPQGAPFAVHSKRPK